MANCGKYYIAVRLLLLIQKPNGHETGCPGGQPLRNHLSFHNFPQKT